MSEKESSLKNWQKSLLETMNLLNLREVSVKIQSE
jgi:hypothetical protein